MSRLQNAPLNVVQITDPHLGNPAGHMYGRPIETHETLLRVLDDISRQFPDPDLMLVTGDLAQEPVAESYRLFQEIMQGLPGPIRCLPGNHDDPRLMEEILSGTMLNCARVATLGQWIVILLNSTIPGRTEGALDHGELRLLEEILARHPERHALVCLHHPVMPVGTEWLDPLGLTNSDALFRVIDQHPQVRGILFGHIHQTFESERRGVRILGTPSTCVQFMPETRDFALDNLSPAWRQLNLHPDGRIETRVRYLEDQQTAQRAAC